MRDPLNPFEDVEEAVQGPFDEGDKLTWSDRNGDAHRLDGPAVEYKKGGRKIWALHGEEVSQKQVAAYRIKLEAEGERRRTEAHNRMVDAEAAQFHTGTQDVVTVRPPIRFKKRLKVFGKETDIRSDD
jgi:hypothetical protein